MMELLDAHSSPSPQNISLKCLIFSQKKFFYILGNGTFWNKDEKLSYVFSKKGFLIFQEIERSSPKIKKKIILFFYTCISYIFS